MERYIDEDISRSLSLDALSSLACESWSTVLDAAVIDVPFFAELRRWYFGSTELASATVVDWILFLGVDDRVQYCRVIQGQEF